MIEIGKFGSIYIYSTCNCGLNLIISEGRKVQSSTGHACRRWFFICGSVCMSYIIQSSTWKKNNLCCVYINFDIKLFMILCNVNYILWSGNAELSISSSCDELGMNKPKLIQFILVRLNIYLSQQNHELMHPNSWSTFDQSGI